MALVLTTLASGLWIAEALTQGSAVGLPVAAKELDLTETALRVWVKQAAALQGVWLKTRARSFRLGLMPA